MSINAYKPEAAATTIADCCAFDVQFDRRLQSSLPPLEAFGFEHVDCNYQYPLSTIIAANSQSRTRNLASEPRDNALERKAA